MKKNILTFPVPIPTTPIDTQLRSAIAGKRLIQFTYNQHTRVAEPHDYGRQNGIDKLLVLSLIHI